MENKEITMYKLMGLIKDGKAPKKIEYDGEIFEWSGFNYKSNGEYISDYIKLKNDIDIPDIKVKILPEENDEWEDIEEINNSADNTLFVMECYTGIPEKAQDWNFNILENKINQLIKNQKRIIEKLEENKND